MELVQNTTRSVKVFLTWVLTSTEPKNLRTVTCRDAFVIEIYKLQSVSRVKANTAKEDFNIALVVWSLCKWRCSSTEKLCPFTKSYFVCWLQATKKNHMEKFLSPRLTICSTIFQVLCLFNNQQKIEGLTCAGHCSRPQGMVINKADKVPAPLAYIKREKLTHNYSVIADLWWWILQPEWSRVISEWGEGWKFR